MCLPIIVRANCQLIDHQISIHQTFRMNGSNFYTIFDLPIRVTNSISQESTFNMGHGSKGADRPLCALRNNPLINPEEQSSSTTPMIVTPWIGNGSNIEGADQGNGGQSGVNGGNSGNGNGGDGNGGDNRGNGYGGGSGGSQIHVNPQPTVCATINSMPVSCTEAPQTGVSLTNLVPSSAFHIRQAVLPIWSRSLTWILIGVWAFL